MWIVLSGKEGDTGFMVLQYTEHFFKRYFSNN